MTTTWTPQQLERIAASDELSIAVMGTDGDLRRPVPIWVVRVGEDVYVRTWYRRSNGWFGHLVDSQRARIQVADVEADVAVDDIGDTQSALRADIDAAYRTKYAHYGRASVDQMVSDSAASTTLKLRVV
jgi:hypothetical protein